MKGTKEKENKQRIKQRDTDRKKQVIKQWDTCDLTDHTKRQKNERTITNAGTLDEWNEREK
jgi:hypothetical protein